MEMSPQRVRSAEFKTVRKGVDPDEVRVFLSDVADELERAQNQSTAMEARARAAVARLQEVGDAPAASPEPKVEASVDEAETISRTLLLAQRTADSTIAEAKAEASKILAAANDEAASTRDSTREMAAQMVDEARTKARQAGEAERVAVSGEVDALKARRDFLESDVEQLEIFLTDQRARVREAATSLLDVVDRVPGGLGDVRAPLLSASDDEDTGPPTTWSDTATAATPATADDLVIVTDIADDTDGAGNGAQASGPPGDDAHGAADSGAAAPAHSDDDADSVWGSDHTRGGGDADDPGPWSDEPRDPRDEPTQAMPVVEAARRPDDGQGFRFSFDDDDR